MKRALPVFIAGLMTALSILSCNRDLSTLDTMKLPGVTFDTVGNSSLSVYQFEHLVVKPVFTTGISAANISYEWRINPIRTDTLSEVIGTGKDLDYEMRLKPNTTGQYHMLKYTITDKSSGLKYIMAWPLTVKNNIGEGLVIAETADNLNTDLSHIMSPEVTTGYTGVSVKHHVYSSLNNAFIPGLVKQMRYTKVWTDNVLYAITNNSIVRINTLDYNYSGTNDELFYTPMPEYKSQALSGLYQADVYISNGKLTATNLGVSKKYGIPLDAKFTVPDHVALNPNSGNLTGSYTPVIMIHFYDEVKGGFVYQPTLQFGDTKIQAVPAASGKAFDPANVPNKINMAAGISVEKDFLHLLKDKTTGKFALYVLDQGIDQYPSPIPPSPKALYDLSNAPEIGNATQFVLLNDQKVMYYATANKIYAVLYSSSPAIVEERYTAAAGEQITTLQVYQQAGYPVGFPYIATNNQQLVMSTWGTEGKVYLLPIKNPGLGTIDAANGKSFGGFGRITAIAPQK